MKFPTITSKGASFRTETIEKFGLLHEVYYCLKAFLVTVNNFWSFLCFAALVCYSILILLLARLNGNI